MATGRKSDFTLPTFDSIFSTQEQRDDAKLAKIRDIPISEIDDFPDHPFKVRDDEDMLQLVESIKERGVITPATVRQKEDDRRFNAQKFEEQFYNTKGLRDVGEGKTAPMPKFEGVVEMLDPMAKVVEEQSAESEVKADENMELIAKLLANPETASLLKALAKSL